MFSPLRVVFDRVVLKGDVAVHDSSGKAHRFGDGTGRRVAISIKDAKTERQIAFDPSLALGEAYMDGRLIVHEGRIYDLLEAILQNDGATGVPVLARLPDVLRYVLRPVQQYNPVGRSRSNVAHHYDIDSSIYDLFLDADRQYSCAYFEPGDDDLDTAQVAKKRHIASKLALEPGHTVLDIGSGWGGLALYLADTCGVDVTGITLSEEQLNASRARADAYRGPGSVSFQARDYRRVRERFDRIVSVGMFEHVGINHYRRYFRQVAELLDDDGVALIHTIGRNDIPAATNAFIRKYIFPGGYIPALSEIMPAVERAGLHLCDVEVLRLHYAETLRHWRARFIAQWDKAAGIRDERFCRMWEFYLAGSEAAFRFQKLVVFQLQLAKRPETLAITRNYMIDEEQRLRERENQLRQPERMAGE